jgi:hypothetical protein
MSLCDQYRLEGLRISANLLLAEVHLEFLHATERAREIVVAAQPSIRQNGSLALQLRTSFLLAKICMSSVTAEDQSPLEEADRLLGQAFAMARRLESVKFQKKILYYMARIYHEMDREDDRDEASELFLQLDSTDGGELTKQAKAAYFLYVDELSTLI